MAENDNSYRRSTAGNEPSGRKGCGCFGMTGCLIGCLVLGGLGVAALIVLLIIGGCSAAMLESMGGWEGLTSFETRKYVEETVSGTAFAARKIAVIDVVGVISSEDSTMGTTANSNMICEQLDQAMLDPTVHAVILYLNTPGGEVTASDNIHHKVLQVREAKPVVAVMNSLAASGGYYVAAGCNAIVANRLTLTGSIGVIIQTYNYAGLFDKLGLKSESFTSGPMKGMLDGANPARTPEEVRIVQTLVNNAYQEFAKIVSEGRKIPLEKITGTEIGDGRVFDGAQALKLGLVDKLGSFDDGVAEAARLAEIEDSVYSVVRYQPPLTFSSLLAQFATSARPVQLKMPGAETSFSPERGKLYFLPFSH